MFIYAIFPHANIFYVRVDILELSCDNYKVWKEIILFYLGCMDIDYDIKKDEPIIIDINTLAELALHEIWERSNRLSVMFI